MFLWVKFMRWRHGESRRADQPPTNYPNKQITPPVGTLINERFFNPKRFS
jgi:hypothetical protein